MNFGVTTGAGGKYMKRTFFSFITVLSALSLLSSCTSSPEIIPYKTKCDKAGEISKDGKFACYWHGAGVWIPIADFKADSDTKNNADEITPLVYLGDAKTEQEALQALNNLGFGRWKSVPGEISAQGMKFVSNYNCILFMADSFQDALDYWNYNVNGQFYGGKWLATDDFNWVINDASINIDGKASGCIEYFRDEYGGTIKQQQ